MGGSGVGDNRRVAAITGATGEIGGAIARGIAAEAGYEVVLVEHNEDKARRAVQEIRSASGNDMVRYEIAELSQHQAIRSLSARWAGPLHVLINNAAAVPRSRRETPQGFEMQFATNVLGYFWMIQEFTDVLALSAPSRVINVASYWAGNLDLDDLEFKRRPYDNGTAYRQSKQANRMLTVSFAERLGSSGVTVNACHPGDVHSNLSHGLGFGGHESAEEAARTPVWLALSDVVGQTTGNYFADHREEPDRFAEDRESIERLHSICESDSSDEVAAE